MKLYRPAAAMIVGLGAIAHPLIAKTETSIRYAETAAAVAKAIHRGDDLETLKLLPPISSDEMSELAALKGCSLRVRPGGNRNMVTFDGSCLPPVRLGREALDYRTITMRFKDNADMFAIAINPTESKFAPTKAELASTAHLDRKNIGSQFAAAVIRKDDPTLGGIVPLTALQLAELAVVKGRKVEQFQQGDGTVYVTWFNGSQPGDDDLQATIYFDSANRPVGVVVERSLLREVVEVSVNG